ncbi:uncharacterized protein LOC118437151 isoform X2 [Folsomia candida]|uniref:uncharacterized protein LOC118437151 isoform X2 n=1 Tax=Folsomia candida TaxID=158441 RepID=UPI0016053FD6|nr:uncharacterized protein LOC118437151 isoform X2 [Folsomia candida]
MRSDASRLVPGIHIVVGRGTRDHVVRAFRAWRISVLQLIVFKIYNLATMQMNVAGSNLSVAEESVRAACRQRNSSRTSRTVASKTLIVAEGASVSDVSTYVLCPQTAAWDGRRVVSLVRGVAVTD